MPWDGPRRRGTHSETAGRADPSSRSLAEELIRQLVAGGDLDRAEPMIEAALSMDSGPGRPEVVVPWLEVLVAIATEDGGRPPQETTPSRTVGPSAMAPHRRVSP